MPLVLPLCLILYIVTILSNSSNSHRGLPSGTTRPSVLRYCKMFSVYPMSPSITRRARRRSSWTSCLYG